MNKNFSIGILGLGYVGLPLAVEFSKKYSVVGFDINDARIKELKQGKDYTLEVDSHELNKVIIKDINELKSNFGLFLSSSISDLQECNFYIITVPTPVDKFNRPILTPLIKASETVAEVLKKGDYVIYESTVYPGATEEDCLPILEDKSGLKLNKDFYLGYSPERINPGDKKRGLTKIVKITSGSTKDASIFIDKIYRSIIEVGTHMAPNIKVAEAAKVLENSQRDINIAFINEQAKIFNLLEIDTQSVLEAAATKWNFLQFKPGLVGGHCIGVDPYYMAQKAQEMGYNPAILLSGRKINESMGNYVGDELIKALIFNDKPVKKSRVLILGITFKENCPDIRNTGVIGLINRLNEFGIDLTVYDPWADINEVFDEYSINIINETPNNKFDAIVLAVAHQQFLNIDFEKLKKCDKTVVYDIKGILQNFTHRL